MALTPELPRLAQMAKVAGDIVLAMRDHVMAHRDEWETKPDDSIVTPADKTSHRILKGLVANGFPGMAFLSEEGTKDEIAEAVQANEYIATDPLDVTTGYIEGWEGYSVNIGRVKDGRPVEGAVYFQLRGKCSIPARMGKPPITRKMVLSPKKYM